MRAKAARWAPPQVSELNATLTALSTRDLTWCNEELQTRSSLSMRTPLRAASTTICVECVCILLCYNLIYLPALIWNSDSRESKCARASLAACGARFSVLIKAREHFLLLALHSRRWKMQIYNKTRPAILIAKVRARNRCLVSELDQKWECFQEKRDKLDKLPILWLHKELYLKKVFFFTAVKKLMNMIWFKNVGESSVSLKKIVVNYKLFDLFLNIIVHINNMKFWNCKKVRDRCKYRINHLIAICYFKIDMLGCNSEVKFTKAL